MNPLKALQGLLDAHMHFIPEMQRGFQFIFFRGVDPVDFKRIR